MKITQVLYKQHIGRQIRKLWYIKRERQISNDKIDKYLTEKYRVEIKDALEVSSPKQTFTKYFLKNLFLFFLQIITYIACILLISIANYILYQAQNRGTQTKITF